MQTLVKDKIETGIRAFGEVLERKLGLTKDDLMCDMREQVWKAIITHNPAMGANLSTWTRNIIEKRFGVLRRKAEGHKYSSIEYYADVFQPGIVNAEQFVEDETGETLFERRHEFIKDLAYLGESDRMILAGLAQGFSIAELVEATRRSRPEVVASISRIDILIKKRREVK